MMKRMVPFTPPDWSIVRSAIRLVTFAVYEPAGVVPAAIPLIALAETRRERVLPVEKSVGAHFLTRIEVDVLAAQC